MLIALAAGVGARRRARVARARRARSARSRSSSSCAALVALLVGPVLGETTPHFPLYIVEALLVEARRAALLTRGPLAVRRRRRRADRHASASPPSGAGRTCGCRCRGRPRCCPRPSRDRARMAVAGGVLGAWLGSAPARAAAAVRRAARGSSAGRRARDLRARRLRARTSTGSQGVTRERRAARRPRRRERHVTRRSRSIRRAAEDAKWLTTTAWQGGGLVVDRLQRVREGVYRTTQPIPVYGDWKAMFRLHRGTLAARRAGLPARGPGDPGQGGPGAAVVRARVRARQADPPARGQGGRRAA